MNNCARLAAALLAFAAVASPPDHIVIVVEENHSFQQIIGNPDAPFLNALAAGGLHFTNFYAITHPSQPNYLHFFSGASQGVTSNAVPDHAPFSTPNLASSLLAAGKTFIGYADGLPYVGSLDEASYSYFRKHNPWVNWQSPTPGPHQILPELNRPFTDFPSDFNTLPTISFVIPDLDHDMHDGTIAQADTWLQQSLGAYADWASDHNSILIVTWDEDESASRNRIPTIIFGAGVRQGTIDSSWTLHNLLRWIQSIYSLSPSGAASDVAPIVGILSSEPETSFLRFRQGENAYSGCVDTFIDSASPSAAHGSDSTLVADGTPQSQHLLRFNTLFGPEAVPENAIIHAATLRILTGGFSDDKSVDPMPLHRMLTDWNAASTWNSLSAGVQLDNSDAAASPENPINTIQPRVTLTWVAFDVTASVKAWQLGQPNFGWVIAPSGSDGWRTSSANAAVVSDRPVLDIVYSLPTCPADFNRDGFLDGFDYDEFVACFEGEACPPGSSPDFNADGFLDGFDYDEFVAAFESDC